MPDGRDYIVATITFNTKVTETSYLRIRTAILSAYQDALKMREVGFSEEGAVRNIDGEQAASIGVAPVAAAADLSNEIAP
jgi:hypothetical protein